MKEQDKVREALQKLGSGYELVRELGRGATAIVYLVRDTELDRDLAVKVIRSTFAHDEEAVARLRREARLVAKLQHPNIVRVFSARHLPDGSLALLMEHVPGKNLKEVLRSTGPFEPERALDVLRDVASALAYAHRRRIVHRDVKPENIYVDEEVGTARLADFGIARAWDRDARLTVPGEALGTPAYMSPEQIDGDDVDARTDVYSLGLVGYEILAGEHPWEDDNLYNIIFKQKNEELPPLRTVRPGLPRDLVDVLERALRKDRERRWASADELLGRLEAIRLPDVGGMSAELAADAGPTVVAGSATAPAGSPEASLPQGIDLEGADDMGPPPGPGTTEDPPTRAGHGAGRDVGEGTRWRKGRLALAAAAAGGVALLAWGWSAWGGDGGEGWVALDGGDPGASSGAAAASPTADSAAGGDQAGGSDGTLQVVEDEVPAGGTVGASVPLAYRVLRADSADRIRLRVVDGEGTLDRESADVGADGIARATLRLPDRPGETTVAAAIDGAGGSEIRWSVLATPGPPQRVQAIVGDGQIGVVDSLLPLSLGVRVLDALGNPIADTDVRFQVLTGNGTVQPPRVRTDPLGRAFARWRLGPAPGEQRVVALVPSAEESTVVFGGSAQAAAPAEEPGLFPDPGPPAPDDPTAEPAGADSVDEVPSPASSAGAGTVRVVPNALAVGGTHVCVLGAQRVAECHGGMDPGDGGGAVRVRFAALASGVRHACGLDAAGTAFCWGANNTGQLGDGTRTDRSARTPVETTAVFSELALGLDHSCGLDGAGRVHCWGGNVNGQLGDGARDDHAAPRPVAGLERVVQIVTGWNHTCALGSDGRARCWGLNSDGQLGDGSRVDRLRPRPVAGGATFSVLAAGSSHTCGLSGDVVRCWGADRSGQLGVGGTASQGEPTRVESLPETVADIVAGAVHSCALLGNGEAWCWGQNIHGQLGDGSTTDRRRPVPVSGGLRFRVLKAGGGTTCGITEDGARYCWGLNQGGQLGDGTRINRSTPTRVG